MNNDSVKLKRSIFHTPKVSLDFFMYEPNATIGTGNSYTLNINPILMLRYNNPNMYQDGKTDFQDNTYKISVRNHYKIVKFFNEIVHWFYDKEMEDLFLTSDDNQLIFNADYNKLHLTLSPIGKDSSVLKAIPLLMEDQDSKRYEGICLYINKQANAVELTLSEVETLLQVLSGFSFQSEVVLNLLGYSYAKSHNLIYTSDKWHGNNQLQIKTPFDK